MILGGDTNNRNDASSYGRHFDHWRAECADQWHAFTRHKFVLTAGDGSLPQESFIRYIRQDYIFLIQFARLWGRAASKGSDIREIKIATAMMHELVNSKMQMHVELCNDEGISEQELFETKEAPATTAYLSHLETVGTSGDFIDMMSVLSPSYLGYAEIGAYLTTIRTAPVYERWIKTYTDKNNQILCHEIGTMIDDAIVSHLGTDAMTTFRWQGLCDRFRITTELEAGFFEMAMSR